MSDDHQQRDFFAITEHRLFEAVFYAERHLSDTMRFFRIPATSNDNGGESGTLPEIKHTDVREGDTLLVIDIWEGRLTTLRLMHVTKIEANDFYYVLINDFLGSWGQDLIDRFAGLLGRVPTE